jgi:hypothetical protein
MSDWNRLPRTLEPVHSSWRIRLKSAIRSEISMANRIYQDRQVPPKGLRFQKTTKRLSKEELMFQPWFLPARVALLIRWLVPPDYRQRMHDYFNDYGCMRCGKFDGEYRSNGMCHPCMSTVFSRLESCAWRRTNGVLSKRYGEQFVKKAQEASKLLQGLRPPKARVSPKGRMKSVQLNSPVIATFDRYRE